MTEDERMNMNSALVKAMRDAYRLGQEDEALEPIVRVGTSGEAAGRISEGDSVIFYDIRGEREVEITQSLTEPDFSRFPVERNLNLNFVTMIEYQSNLKVKVAFPPEGKIKNTLTEVITKQGLSLVKVAESEKAIHVGYFMNGKNEQPFPGEKRIIVPSPDGLSSYASVPEMSSRRVARAICEEVRNPSVPVIIGNLANVDVLGHIENRKAVLEAVESVDKELGNIYETCCEAGITLVVTADHGTAEEWQYPDGTINTGHTKNPVPFVIADFAGSETAGFADLQDNGELGDVAPTLLHLLGLPLPEEMTGKSLLPPGYGRYTMNRRILLLILDGWGMNEDKFGNLIAEASTPNFDKIWAQYPHTVLKASGEAVGMPSGTVGNSEAGHLHIGAGRHIFLDRVRIDRAIENGSFFNNASFRWAMEKAKAAGRALHLLGIVSHYSSHGTIDHLFALIRMAKELGNADVFVHALIGRRGERPESGALYVDKVESMCRSLQTGEVVTVMGRHWALDREDNWDRVEKAYRALVYGQGTPATASQGTFS